MSVDPGWRGSLRYALPVPNFIAKRAPGLHAPTKLHEWRGLTEYGAMLSALFSIAVALYVAAHGRVRIGEQGSGVFLFFPGLFVLGIVGTLRARRTRFAPSHGPTALGAFRNVSAIPVFLGVAGFSLGNVIASATGWWPAALLGGASGLVGACLGAPTRKRIEAADAAYRAHGYTGSLLDDLLSSPSKDDSDRG